MAPQTRQRSERPGEAVALLWSVAVFIGHDCAARDRGPSSRGLAGCSGQNPGEPLRDVDHLGVAYGVVFGVLVPLDAIGEASELVQGLGVEVERDEWLVRVWVAEERIRMIGRVCLACEAISLL